jgi:hypothetical protein
MHTQPSAERMEPREGEVAHPSAQIDPRRRAPASSQTGLPRPTLRDPPSLMTRQEVQAKPNPSSSFGFARTGTTPAGQAPPQLRGKSSRNVLRRKPSSIAQPTGTSMPRSSSALPSAQAIGAPQTTERRPSVDSSLRSAEAYNEIFTRNAPRASPAMEEPPAIIPELDRYRSRPQQPAGPSRMKELPHKLSTQDLPPPFPTTVVTPVYSGGSGSHHRSSGYSGSGYSVSPSTRFSESPGPGASAYSRDTTPTSMSSQSPGIFLPMKTTTPRLRQGNAPIMNRPPVSSTTRRRAGSSADIDSTGSPVESSGLSIVRESLTSSSSNSTVKGDGKSSVKERKKKNRLSPLPPSPPPRKSSQKFKKPRSGEFNSPSKQSQSPAKPVMVSPPGEFDFPSKVSRIARPVMTSPEDPAYTHSKSLSEPVSAHSRHPTELPPAIPTRPLGKREPPVRPSRDGAPDLQETQLGDSMAIIQSNLPGLSFSPEQRRSGMPSPLHVQTNLRPQGSRIPSRNPSPSPVLPSPREATPAPSGLGIIPDLKPPQMPSSARGRTPSPSQASKHRFGLFSRRTKTEGAVEYKEKPSRKGPTAGTGHEGYGKYALRGRSSSQGGQGRRDRSLSIASSSQESITSITAAHDPFLLHRMSPVIIAGGGEVIENLNSGSELYLTESNNSVRLDRPSMDSRGSSKSNLSHEAPRATLWPSALPKESTRRTSAIGTGKGRRPSDSSDDGFGQTLAMRRSIQRLGDQAVALNLPRPLNIPTGRITPSITSLDTSLMSDDSRMETSTTSVIHRGRKEHATKPKKLEKRPKSPTKWNFFHRSKPSVKDTAPAVAVSVGKPAKKAVPHYALLDSSDEQQEVDQMDLEDIMRDVAVVSLSNEELDKLQFGEDMENLRRMNNLRMDMPGSKTGDSPASISALRPAPLFSAPEPFGTPVPAEKELHLVKETAPVRPSRLPQVGRIPKVISARPETTSPKSFSRPFARLSISQPREHVIADAQSVALGPSPPKPSTPEPVVQSRQTSGDSKTESTSTTSHRDFLAFSPRKNSEATTSSSGGLSINLAGTTAVIPEADAELEEDEVWDEYDDLIENDDTLRAPPSATSSHGVPFQYESYESRRMRKSKMRAKDSPILSEAPKINEPEQRISHITTSSVYSQEMSARLKEALTTLPTPTTPMSFTEFFQGYGDRNNSGIAAHRSSQESSRKSGSSIHSRTLSEAMSIEEQENPSPRSQVNLRVGSMTVSKWLTFGQVLFSPAKEEIGRNVEAEMEPHSVLVVDGLGNGMFPLYHICRYHEELC